MLVVEVLTCINEHSFVNCKLSPQGGALSGDLLDQKSKSEEGL